MAEQSKTNEAVVWLEGADIQVVKTKGHTEIVFRRDQVARFAKTISTVAGFSTDNIPAPTPGTSHVPTVSLFIEPNRVGLGHGYSVVEVEKKLQPVLVKAGS
jgi:hypothetical protein